MKNKIIAVVVGISMIMTCSTVFAEDTSVKSAKNISLEEVASKALYSNLKADNSLNNLKLNNSKSSLNDRIGKVKCNLKTGSDSHKKSNSFIDASKVEAVTTGPAVTINDSPNNAYAVSIGGAYEGTITSEGGQRWYAFENSFIQKLTIFMAAPNSKDIDYDLHLYKYNEQTQKLELVTESLYTGTATENLSTIGEKGIYFIEINSVKGFDDQNKFEFALVSSDKYSKNEPDDNLLEVKKTYIDSLSIEDTIDNDFDQDWSILKLTTDTDGTLSFQNSSSKGTYEVLVYDENFNLIASLKNNNSLDKKFPKGNYYFRVLPISGSDPDATYKLNFVNKDSIITKATITNISSDADGGFMDYGYGNKWRVHNSVTIQGTAYNQYGKPAANQPIGAGVRVYINNELKSATGFTDANGNFTLSMNIGEAAGQYSYYGPVSTHYFDIIPFFMVSSNGQISTNVDSLYHFAYSMYHEH